MRRLLAVAFTCLAACAPEIPRDEVPVRVTAIFDPGANPAVVPLPNDLAKDPVTGLLSAIKDAPNATPAQRELNGWLRTLDGFPITAQATVAFDRALAPSSVKPSGVRVFDVTDEVKPVEVAGPTVSYEADQKRLTVGFPLVPARTYFVAVLGTAGGGANGAEGEELIGSPAFALLRAKKKLVTCDDLSAPTCASATGLLDDDASALRLERARRKLQPALEQLERSGLGRENLAAAWTFSTLSQAQVTFDPEASVVPFPNDLLIDNGRVALPPDPKDDALSASLKVQLNTLDGFSTSASLMTEAGELVGAATQRLDSDGLLPAHFRIINLEVPSDPVPFLVFCRSCGRPGVAPGAEPDQIVLTPTKPLRSHTRYAVLWLGGATTLAGKGVTANSLFALARGKSPLLVNGKSAVDSVDDLTASLVETLRVKLQPALTAADGAGIPRENVVLAWSFTTQTTGPALVNLARKPADWGLPTTVTGGTGNLVTIDTALLATVGGFIGQDLVSQIRWVKEGEFSAAQAFDPNGVETNFATMATTPTDGAFTEALLMNPRREQRRFILIVPKTPKFTDGRIPVVLYHHGLGQSRRDAAAIGNTLAKAGYATLAIDAPFHGLRSYCQSNSACRGGSACTNHRCLDTLANPNDGYAVRQVPVLGNDPLETPGISGDQFVSPSNLFASRDHFRQQVIDFAQLLRVLEDTTGGIGAIDVDDPATVGVVERLTPIAPRYIGQSLGGIIGTLIMATLPQIPAATLNVPGASMTDVILESMSFSSYRAPLDAYLTGKGWPPGSQGYLRFLDTARWVLDPADPQSVGRNLIAEPLGTNPKKRIFVSWVRDDETIPNRTTALLLNSIEGQSESAFFKEKQYPSGGHVFLLNISSPASATLAIQSQNEAVDWVKP